MTAPVDSQPYILTAISTAFLGLVGAFGFTHKRINSVERMLQTEIAELRTATEADRTRAADQRAQILIMLNDIPKRGEVVGQLSQMEDRLGKGIRNIDRRDGEKV